MRSKHFLNTENNNFLKILKKKSVLVYTYKLYKTTMSLNHEYPIETEESFFAGVLKIIFIFGASFLISSLFVADQVWKPMKMTKKQVEDFIKEREEEEKNKEIPYENRYEFSDDSDIEIVDDESDDESESKSDSESTDNENKSEEKEQIETEEQEQQETEQENSEEGKDAETPSGVNETTDEDISSGELVERPSGDENEVDEEDEQESSDSEEQSESEEDHISEGEENSSSKNIGMDKVTEKIIDSIIEKAVTEIKKTHEQCVNENIKNLIKKPRRKISREEWTKRIEGLVTKKIIEETPLGKVLMYYDSKNETFCYHGKKNIPYNYLETVARKYVRKYDCRPLYIDSRKELEKAREQERKELEKQQEKEKIEAEKMKAEDEDPAISKSSSDNDVFANFKNYKKQTENPTNSQMKSAKLSCSDSDIAQVKKEIGTQQNLFSSGFVKLQKKDETENKLIPLRSNRFTYKGTIDSIQILKHKKKQLKINFATFKKMRMNKFD